jgi:hypothetical protein
MGYSGAGGKLIHEKNQKQKSRDTVPLTLSYSSELNAVLFPQRVSLPLKKCRDTVYATIGKRPPSTFL